MTALAGCAFTVPPNSQSLAKQHRPPSAQRNVPGHLATPARFCFSGSRISPREITGCHRRGGDPVSPLEEATLPQCPSPRDGSWASGTSPTASRRGPATLPSHTPKDGALAWDALGSGTGMTQWLGVTLVVAWGQHKGWGWHHLLGGHGTGVWGGLSHGVPLAP